MRKQFVRTLTALLEYDERVVLLLGDIGVYAFREAFEKFPDRVYNIGILEQASVGVAAGLALEGMIPVFHTIAPFLVERALEQLKIDFGYQGLIGNFVSVGGSYDYSQLGCTHHCPGDVQILNTIPNTTIYVPGHPEEFDKQFRSNYTRGLNYFRLTERPNAAAHYEGMLQEGKPGRNVIAIGPMLDRTLKACEGLDISVHYRNQAGVTAHHSAVIVEPYYEGTSGYPMSIGVPREFIDKYGTPEELDKFCGLTVKQIRERVKEYLHLE